MSERQRLQRAPIGETEGGGNGTARETAGIQMDFVIGGGNDSGRRSDANDDDKIDGGL